MGKMRVHELAKEYGLDNKVVIKLLQQAGMSVKTHSSSVYEDEARQALDKDAKPQAPKPRGRPGMRIVKKRKATAADEAATDVTAAGEEATGVTAAGEEATGVTAAGEEATGVTAAGEEAADVTAEPILAVAEEIATPSATAVAEGAAEAVVPAEGITEPAPAEPGDDQPTEVAAARDVPADASPEAAAVAEGKPKRAGAQVLRMIDRDKLLERVPSNRLGGRDGAPAAGRGGRSFGQVTELKVVTDPFGRGREMVAVNRDKKAGDRAAPRRGRATGRRGRKNMRERAMFPSRLRRKKITKKTGKPTEVTQPGARKRIVKMDETISVADLAHELQVKAVEIIRKLVGLGMMVGINDPLDFETAMLVATDYKYTVESVAFDEEAILDEVQVDDDAVVGTMVSRSPVVTIMGHVDHGKTSILDAIRKTKVADREAGGITQHIGAYSVTVPKKGSITFLDTPGHAAFTEMRARGANVTDIVILVVAADDGVMPQTEEAIRHSQAAGVPIIVAINKMDRPDANAERVTQELTKFNLVPEAWGGETLFVETSAVKKTGLTELLDAILLQAEVLELKAAVDVNAIGSVIEAQLNKGLGPVATVLIQHGTLECGDSVVIGEYAGKVRAMTNYLGKPVKKAGPSDAVEVVGLDGVPHAGDRLNKVDNAEAARDVAEHRLNQRKAKDAAGNNKMSLEDLMRRMSGEEATELNLVLKADVQGSVEAVRAALEKLSTEEVEVKILLAGVGAAKESDILLAGASNGIILSFNVRPDSKARALAQREGVEIRTYNVIYEMIDDVKKAMEGLLTPESKEKIVGRAEVRNTFKISKLGTIAGCRVVEGKAQRSAKVRVLRDNVEVHDGRVSSLKHFKDDVREVDVGGECGVGVEGFNDVKLSDIIEFYEVEEISRTLESVAAGRRPPPQPEARP